MFKKILFTACCLSLILAACAPATPTTGGDGMMEKPTEAMMEKPTETMMEKPAKDDMMEKPTEAMMEEKPAEDMTGDDSMMETPAWFGATLTNARTGETFTINDFKGKVVLVETLAMWCSNCKKQQMEVKSLHSLLGEMGADLVSVGLDVDINENTADLKAYTEANGFDWGYAVAPAEVARDLGQLYGDQFLNPPSTPILLIDRKGQVHPLPFGIKSAEDLKEFITPFLSEGM